jgi:hypothetical protein
VSAKSENAAESPAPGQRRHIFTPDTYVRITLQLFLNLKRQSLHAPAHVRMTHRIPNTASSRDRDHGRNAFKAAVIADEDAPAWIRTCASFNSTSTTAEQLDDVEEEGAAGSGSMTTGTNPRASAPAVWRISRRHLKTRLVQTSSRRATSAITAPGSK